jgi:hypothetical protein
MTDHADTTPPPGPLPSVLPHGDDYDSKVALGKAYVALIYARDELSNAVTFFGGRLNGVDVDLAQLDTFKRDVLAALKRNDAQDAVTNRTLTRIEAALTRIEANQNVLYEHFHAVTGRLTVLEGHHAKNHQVTLSVPPSSRRGEEIAAEPDSAIDIEALEG